jgi:hypothetical protein
MGTGLVSREPGGDRPRRTHPRKVQLSFGRVLHPDQVAADDALAAAAAHSDAAFAELGLEWESVAALRVPLRQRRHIHQVAGRGRAKTAQEPVRAAVRAAAERTEALTAGPCRMSTTGAVKSFGRGPSAKGSPASRARPTDRPSATVTASRVNPGPRWSTCTLAPSERSAGRQCIGEPCHSAGSGVNRSTSCVGRSTKSWASIAPPPARATCPASGNA